MKPKIILLSVISLAFLLFGTSCDIIKTEATYPGISIYKTNGDYFDLVDIGMKGDDIFRTNGYHDNSSRLIFTENDTIYTRRLRLFNGYILDTEADERYDVFLKFTFKEYFLEEEKYDEKLVPDDILRAHILDKNPYVEYYRETTYPKKFLPLDIVKDSAEINNIIRNGELEKYFERIK